MQVKWVISLWMIIVGCFLSILFVMSGLKPVFSDVKLFDPRGGQHELTSPSFLESKGSGIYTLKANFELNLWSGKNFRIIPDDELKMLLVNGQVVNLSSIPRRKLKDYREGFVIDLADYITQEKNAIELTYYDRGGLMGVVITSELGLSHHVAIAFLLLIAFISVFKLISFRYKVSPLFQFLFLIGLVLRIYYFSITPPQERTHDLGDHIGYVEYLSENWLPPSVEKAVGGAYFHPPLYYYTGAVVYKISQIFEPHNKVILRRIQQVLSLFYSLGFLFFGLLILQELARRYDGFQQSKSGRSSLISSCLSLFSIVGLLFSVWPVSIIHSVRIGNDPLLYFLFSFSLYYIVLWYRKNLNKHLYVAAIIGALAIIAKANGEILIAVIGVVGLYKMIRSQQWLHYLKLSIVPCLIMFSATAITVAPGLILKLEGKRDKLYIDDIDGLSKANLVGNTAANYFWFDAKVFITKPYTDPYDDSMGRQYFWNYLGKTGLFGEFKYKSQLSTNAAIVCSFFAVGMLLYIFGGLYHSRKEDFRLCAVICLSGFFLWGGVTYMRMTFPANIDFRYILPILITFSGLYMMSIVAYSRAGAYRMSNIGRFMALSFSFSSMLFLAGI